MVHLLMIAFDRAGSYHQAAGRCQSFLHERSFASLHRGPDIELDQEKFWRRRQEFCAVPGARSMCRRLATLPRSKQCVYENLDEEQLEHEAVWQPIMLTMGEIRAESSASLHPSLRRLTTASLRGSSADGFLEGAVILEFAAVARCRNPAISNFQILRAGVLFAPRRVS